MVLVFKIDVIAFKKKLHTKRVAHTKCACFVFVRLARRQCTIRKNSIYSLIKLEELISHYIKTPFFFIESSQN